MAPPSVAIGNQLAFEIARIKPCEPGRIGAVAAPVQPVAREAGARRTGRPAAQRDQFAGRPEPLRRGRLGRRAGAKQERRGNKEAAGHGAATGGAGRWFLPLLLLAACKPPPEQRVQMAQADPARGKAAIERVGCGSCHRIPGIAWPQGKVGPALDGLAERALIAGHLPNRPDLLSGYIRNAPALVPGSGMPAMPVSDEEARDIAAYLYAQGSQ